MDSPTYRILVVDDDQSVLETYRRILQPTVDPESVYSAEISRLEAQLFGPAGQSSPPGFDLETGLVCAQNSMYELTMCEQGHEAVGEVRKAKESAKSFSVCFLDVRMPPGPDGIITGERMRAIDPDMMIVIVTGFSDVPSAQIAQRIPPVDKLLYVQKPFHPQEILHLAASMSAMWRVNRQLKSTVDNLQEANQQLRNEIHNRLRVEQELLDKERLLRQAQRLDALGTLAGGVAHDFKNLLTGIVGYCEVVKAQLPAQSALHDYMNLILRAGTRAEELVNQILSFGSNQEGELQPLELAKIVTEVLQFSQGAFAPNIEVWRDIDPFCPNVLGDSTQLHQLVMNLVNNAVDAMAERGGVLEVKLHVMKMMAAGRGVLGAIHPGDYVCFSVRDNGCGMDPATIERIFDPYFTTNSEHEGHGLGLATVLGIVKNHGGDILVSSTKNVGSCFKTLFPLPITQEKNETIGEAC